MQMRHVCHVELSQRELGVPDLDPQLDLLATVTQTTTILQVSQGPVSHMATLAFSSVRDQLLRLALRNEVLCLIISRHVFKELAACTVVPVHLIRCMQYNTYGICCLQFIHASGSPAGGTCMPRGSSQARCMPARPGSMATSAHNIDSTNDNPSGDLKTFIVTFQLFGKLTRVLVQGLCATCHLANDYNDYIHSVSNSQVRYTSLP